MRSVELTKAPQALRRHAAELSHGPLVLTRGGKAVAVMVSVRESDLESFLVSESPAFKRIVRKSCASYRRSGGLTRDELEKRLARVPKASPR
jgi:hypothetical protein